jgi:VWFA-related protein
MTVRDSIALVTSSRIYGIAQQFTRDRQALRYAIDGITLGPNQIDRGIFPYLAARITLGDNIALEKGKQILKAEGVDDKSGSLTRGRSLMVLDEASLLRETTLAALKAVTEQMIGMSGQRMIVIFSEGFTQHGRNGWPEYNEVRSATNQAVRAGVAIYSIDAKSLGRDGGNDPDGYGFAAAQEELGGMFSMAKDTGGETFVNTNNLSGALSEALDANRSYYVLAYYPVPGEDLHEFRNISIHIPSHPDYKIRTPKGFTIPTNKPEKEEDQKESQKDFIRAINAIKPGTGINVLSRMDFIGLKSGKQQVMLTVSFDGDKLQYRQQNQNQIINLEILYSIFDSAGRQVEAHSADVEGVLTSERAAKGRTNGYLFSKLLALKPGIYQARIGVRDTASGRMGTATAWIDVPNLARKKLALSDLILFDSVPGKEAAETGVHADELRPVRMLEGIRLYPRDNVCSYVFRVFRSVKSAVDSDLTLKTELLKEGKPVKQSQWMPLTGVEKGKKEKGQVYIGGKVDFAGLHPGVYELIVSVKDARSKKTAQRSAVFGIE